ncbi:MAG: histidine kinase [Alphaproteobacteria bacterium]|nr:histidine kinase [Alphaproteobacteria bacterium]
MEASPALLPAQPETVAHLRDLYRASEARAARLRLLIEAGRDLASVTPDTIEAVLARSARRAALFAGSRDGEIVLGAEDGGLPLVAPGAAGRCVGVLRLADARSFDDVADAEDRDALVMLAQLIAEAVDRAARDTEREALLATLRERERRLEDVVGRLFSAQEDERRRVSRELHDGVAQTATALFRRLEVDAAPELAAIARDLVRELRGVIGGLRPTTLDDLGLEAAVSALVQGLRDDGYAVAFEASGGRDWPEVIETAFYRIAQEAIANIRKHAGGPCPVTVRLTADAAARRWEIAVRDRGCGMALRDADRIPGRDGERVGLEMMRERMLAIGGTLRFRAPADGGAELVARVEGRAA